MTSNTSNITALTIDLTIDTSPWENLFDNLLYKMWFHALWGPIYLGTGVMSLGFWLPRVRRQRLSRKHAPKQWGIPEIMLAIEGVTMVLNGLYLTAFGCWVSHRHLPNLPRYASSIRRLVIM